MKEKRNILNQLLNISAYEGLHQQAKATFTQYKNDVAHYNQELNSLEVVSDDELQKLKDELVLIEQQNIDMAEQRIALGVFKAQARQWQELQSRRTKLDRQLEEARSLLLHADEIEQKAERRSYLDKNLPTLRNIWQWRQEITDAEENNRLFLAQAQEQAVVVESAKEVKNKLEFKSQQFQAQQNEASDRLRRLQQQKLELASPLRDLEEMERLEKLVKRLNVALSTYSDHLDSQLDEMTAEVARLVEIEQRLPWLRNFANSFRNWQKSRTVQVELQAKLDELNGLLTAQKQDKQNLDEQRKTTTQEREEALQKQSASKADLNAMRKQLEQFEQVDGKPSCTYCGQVLTVEHLAAERDRLNKSLGEAQFIHREVIDCCNKLDNQLRQVDKQITVIEQKIVNLGDENQTVFLALESAKQTELSEAEKAQNAFEQLSEDYQQVICQTAVFSLEECGTFPSENDLVDLKLEVGKLAPAKVDLAGLQSQVTEREMKKIELLQPSTQLQELREQYPKDRVEAILQTQHELESELSQLSEHLEELKRLLKEAQQQYPEVERKFNEAQKKQQHLLTELGKAQNQIQNRKDDIERGISELPQLWRDTVSSLTKTGLYLLEAEQKSLEDAFDQRQKLLEARSQETSYAQQLYEVTKDLAEIPADAQKSVVEIEIQERNLQKDQENIKQSITELQKRKGAWEQIAQRRSELTEKRKTAEQEMAVYQRLTEYLGIKHLQQWILHQAEAGIVENANEILDRISSGTLRLELSQKSREEGSDSKVLDLTVWNSETKAKSLPTNLLSGSQQFRVAISLALGIGRYANNRAQPVRSVIIDEGFGSLDKEGRAEIIDELHRLKTLLDRIILVSHQEEFFTRFDNVWSTRLENGASKVSLR